MCLRFLLSTCVLLTLFLAGCDQSVQPEEVESAVENTVKATAPVALPPGDPRNEVIQAVRYPNHGEAKELGMAKFGGAMVNVTQYGPILEGGEGHFMVDVGRTKVAGVYVWIGMEADGQRRKWPATPEPDGYHVHCSVPRPLEDEHALWVEIKLPDGKRYNGQYYIGER